MAPRIAAAAPTSREGRVAGVIQTATSGSISASPPVYFVAVASPAAAPASRKVIARGCSCARNAISSVSVTKNVVGTSVNT